MTHSSTNPSGLGLAEVLWHDLDPTDMEHLLAACAGGYNGETAGHLIEAASRNELKFFRATASDCRCLLVLKRVVHLSNVKELLVYAVGGKGLVKHAAALDEALCKLARRYDCTVIGGRGFSKAWPKFSRLKPTSTYFVMEVEPAT